MGSGKTKDPDYWRKWRAAHPEYRKRQTLLRQQRRASAGREDRRKEYANRRSRAMPEMPDKHRGHEIFDRARALIGPKKTSLVVLDDPLYDDLLSEATLAMLEGKDPIEAVKRYRAQEVRWGRITAPLLIDVGPF